MRFALVLTCLVIASPTFAEDAPAKKKSNPAFEKMKSLVGTWVEADKDGKPTEKVISIFKITAAGSAVSETIFPGSPHEMLTVYHLDGNQLQLVHYCAAQNQPRMKLDPKSGKNQLRFLFAGGTNIDPKKDMHMHQGMITFVDKNTIQWTWQGWMNGKPAADHKVSMRLVRRKK